MESKKLTQIDAFGVVVSSLPEDKGVDCSDSKLIKYKVVLDEEAPETPKSFKTASRICMSLFSPTADNAA